MLLNFHRKRLWLIAIVIPLFFITCKKDEVEGERIGDNDAPYYDGIPTVLVRNYINRLYIDMIGREPLDVEMEADVALLKDNNYEPVIRDSLIDRLHFDDTYRSGDSSYKFAYYNRLYELFKVKMLEGASDADIQRERNMIYGNLVRDSIAGDWYSAAVNLEKVRKLDAVLEIDEDYYNGDIEIKDAFARMLDNAVYDRINMNTFNFVNASFNDLFDRFPTQMEFDKAYDIIEYNKASTVFGQSASNKSEYIEILVNSKEFYEGMIRWAYGTLMAREPATKELEEGMSTFYFDHDLQKLQKTILRTDEYANFN